MNRTVISAFTGFLFSLGVNSILTTRSEFSDFINVCILMIAYIVIFIIVYLIYGLIIKKK